MNTKCEKSLTPRNVYSSILQPQRGVINSEPFTSDSYERTFERTCEHSYLPNYESNLSFDKTTGNISSTADQFIISNDNSLEPKQSKTQLEDFTDGNRKYGRLEQKRRSRSKSTRICKGAPRDREPSRLPWKKILNLFNKNIAIKRYVRSHIVHSVPESSALKKILSSDYRNYLETRTCRSKAVGITRAKGSELYFTVDCVYVFKTRTAKHKRASQVSVVFHDEFVHVVQCQSIKCKKRNHRYCVSRAKLFTSGDIELNPGPIVTQGNNPNNLVELLEFRLAQHGLRILDVGGAGDCFFRVVSHQLYGEPSYHMNVRSTGVQYMRNNPERFIESSTEHSWLRYLANMSHQGTWADALVIQAVADALNLTIHIVESNPGFASVTNISPVRSETDTTGVS